MKSFPPYASPVETGEILRDFLWREFELSPMCFGWLPSMDTWPQKWWTSQLGYWHTRHMRFLEERIRELPGSFDERAGSPANMRDAYTRISLAPSTTAFWTGYLFLLQELYCDYDALLAVADPVTNSPTVDCLRQVLLEREMIGEWITANPLARYPSTASTSGPDEAWLTYSRKVLAASETSSADDGIDWPAIPNGKPLGPLPENGRSDPSMIPSDFRTRLSESEQESYEFYLDQQNSPVANNVRQMIFINSTEIIAAELVAYIYCSSTGLELQFYYDTARHTWDEVRHTEMGLRRLKQMGFAIEQFRYWGPCHVVKDATALDHYQFYADLTNRAEACSFGYKRSCAEAFRKHGDLISAVQSEFDIADERLHTGYGARWSPELFKLATGESMTASALVEKYRVAALKKKGYSDEQIAANKKILNNFCGAAEGLGKHITAVASAAY